MIAPVALTSGEPAGIGPELAMKAWAELKEELPFFVIGDPDHLAVFGPVEVISSTEETQSILPRALPVLAQDFGGPARAGRPRPAHAAHVIDVIARGVKQVQQGTASALCTLPIHKKALMDGAGFAYPGHTEYLAALCGVDRVVMMLAAPKLRVVPVTIHIALSEVPARLTGQLIRDTIHITAKALQRDFDVAAPRIAVAGLNPHAGEGGAMGKEEIEIITPALGQLRQDGFSVIGPLSADTMFHDRARATYDVAVCMYHDQALIPIKALDFDHGVNITLGLPIIRTSPDHGTGFDIAGRGKADPTSTISALRMAAEMATRRSASGGGGHDH